jgi:hypothetical protein
MNESKKAYQLIISNGTTDRVVARSILLQNGVNMSDRGVLGSFGKAMQVNRYRHAPLKDKKVEKPDNGNITALYREWCMASDHIASDEQLAHFTGKTAQAFYAARRRAAETGFTFGKNAQGWIVKTRPTPPAPAPEPVAEKTYTQAEVKAIMSELLEKFGK